MHSSGTIYFRNGLGYSVVLCVVFVKIVEVDYFWYRRIFVAFKWNYNIYFRDGSGYSVVCGIDNWETRKSEFRYVVLVLGIIIFHVNGHRLFRTLIDY